MHERATQSQEVETQAGAVEVKENADMARIQMIFPGKPDEATGGAQGQWLPLVAVEAGRWAAERVMKGINAEGAA